MPPLTMPLTTLLTMPSATPARGRFTLLELLVVVSIIMALASLLLPVLMKARNKVNETACASNLKQISTAVTMYADNNDDWVIPASNTWNWDFWIGSGSGGYSLNNGNYLPDRYPKVAICPSSRLEVAASYAPTKYAINIQIAPLSVPTVMPAVRYNALSFAERTIVAMDSSANTSTPTVARAAFEGVGGPGFWHGRRANISLADGHVAAVMREDSSSVNDLNLDYDRTGYTFRYR